MWNKHKKQTVKNKVYTQGKTWEREERISLLQETGEKEREINATRAF